MLPIIDTHQHLWDLSRFRLPWLDGFDALNRSYVMSDYLDAARDLNVVKTVYMEVDVDESQQGDEVAYVTELCRDAKNPMAAAVISGRPQRDDFASYLDAHNGIGFVKGVRRVLHTEPPGTCFDPAFVRGVRQLGDRGLSFDLCARSAELGDCVKLVEQCPDTRFVLDHCGNASVAAFARSADADQRAQAAQWKRDIDALAQHERVICKISGIVAGAPENWTANDLAPPINHCLDAFGPERVVFGGDWPVCTIRAALAQWVGALGQIIADRPEDQQRKLLHDNAVRFYGL